MSGIDAPCPHIEQRYEHDGDRTWTCLQCGATSQGKSLVGTLNAERDPSDAG